MGDLVERLRTARLINPQDQFTLQDEAAAEITRLTAEVERLRGVVVTCDTAISEMFRYFDGGETRGSYDGRPERDQLRKAGYAVRAALAAGEAK